MTFSDNTTLSALKWVVVIRDPNCSSEELAALDVWLDEDPVHERVFWEVDEAWRSAEVSAQNPLDRSDHLLDCAPWKHPLLINRDPDLALMQCLVSDLVLVPHNHERNFIADLARLPNSFGLPLDLSTGSSDSAFHAMLSHCFKHVLFLCFYRYTHSMDDAQRLFLRASEQDRIDSVFQWREIPLEKRARELIAARYAARDSLMHREVVPLRLVSDLDALERLDEVATAEDIVNSENALAVLVAALAPRDYYTADTTIYSASTFFDRFDTVHAMKDAGDQERFRLYVDTVLSRYVKATEIAHRSSKRNCSGIWLSRTLEAFSRWLRTSVRADE